MEKKPIENLIHSIEPKKFQEIPKFYSTFDNFMKNKIKNQISNKSQYQNEGYNFSKLMNSLHEYNKKKSNIELKISKDETKKKEKLFKGISLQKFNDNLSKKKHNIFTKKQDILSSYIITKQHYLKQKIEKKEENNNVYTYEENSNINNEIKDYENLEKIILKLIDTIKNKDDFGLICNEWIDKVEKIKKEKSNIIKVKKRNYIGEKEKSINLLIISIIVTFLRLNLYEFNDNFNRETIIKDLSEIMSTHHKIFLLLCYDLILNNIHLKDNNNDKDDIFDSNTINFFLFEQIKIYLPKNIYINNINTTINKNIFLEKEIKSFNSLLYFMLKSLLSDIEKNAKNDEIKEFKFDQIFYLNSKELIELFKKLYQSKKEKNNNLNTINIKDKTRPIINYRNKRFMKKHFLIDEKDIYKTTNDNYSYKKTKGINSYKDLKYTNNYNLIKNTFDNEKTKLADNINLPNGNQTMMNSSSCKIIPPSSPSFLINSNKKGDIYNFNTNNNMSINDISQIKKITQINPSKLFLNTINISKPRPPFLTQNIQYSKFNKKIFTLILDLDETLIKFQIGKDNLEKGKILFRPGLFQFLNKAFPLFDLILWTVATKDYADNIINNIEKDKKFFSARLYREHATSKNKIYVKDLSNLGRPLDKVIIIDDKESSFSLQRNNGILIRPFHGSKWECQNDYVLMDLYNILTKIIFDRSKDVRIGINKYKKEILKKISNNINNSDNSKNFINN